MLTPIDIIPQKQFKKHWAVENFQERFIQNRLPVMISTLLIQDSSHDRIFICQNSIVESSYSLVIGDNNLIVGTDNYIMGYNNIVIGSWARFYQPVWHKNESQDNIYFLMCGDPLSYLFDAFNFKAIIKNSGQEKLDPSFFRRHLESHLIDYIQTMLNTQLKIQNRFAGKKVTRQRLNQSTLDSFFYPPVRMENSMNHHNLDLNTLLQAVGLLTQWHTRFQETKFDEQEKEAIRIRSVFLLECLKS